MRAARVVALGIALSSCAAPPTDSARPSEWKPEAGFVDLPADIATLDGIELESPPARVFYAFRPAREDPDHAPLIVLHAGGPGASMLFLLAYGTGPRTIGGDGQLADNAAALADAHLLYLDARQAGFSYAELEDPTDYDQRRAAFSAAVFNPFRDAADLLTALFAVFDRHPSLETRDLFLLGESYAGLRSNVALSLVLFAPEYAAGLRRFHAPSLFRAIEQRMARALGRKAPAPSEVTSWFWGQILLQPWFAGVRQEQISGRLLEQAGSPLDDLAAKTGNVYLRCEARPGCDAYWNARAFLAAVDRSAYDIRAPADWSERHAAAVADVATHRDKLSDLLGITPEALDAVLDRDRTRAYRFLDVGRRLTAPQGDLESHWGVVSAWDAYFATVNEDARAAFLGSEAQSLTIDPNQEAYGELMLENLRYVPTLLTRAEQDLVIYAPAIAPTLASYPVVRQVIEASSAEELNIEYVDETMVSVEAPRYPDASHSVLRDQPAELLGDVARFVRDARQR